MRDRIWYSAGLVAVLLGLWMTLVLRNILHETGDRQEQLLAAAEALAGAIWVLALAAGASVVVCAFFAVFDAMRRLLRPT